MAMKSINPATEEELGSYDEHTPEQVSSALDRAVRAARDWRARSFTERAGFMTAAASYMRDNKDRLGRLITLEMGKPITEAVAEIEKCAWNCDHYAEHAEDYLRAESHPTNASESYVRFQPLGVVLAIMPWNFPFWQAMRFAAPALMGGNVAVLKHASNVPQCALAIEEIFRAAGCPEGVFTTLLVGGSSVQKLIEDPRVAAVTLTGSSDTGSAVASAAGRVLKKQVLELGGSDPFVVLEDADLEAACSVAVRARNQNSGQSCISSKRFIVASQIVDEFMSRFTSSVGALRVGDPLEKTTQIGPLARADLVDSLDSQVQRSASSGASVRVGGSRVSGRGYFYSPTVVFCADRSVPVMREETFGPVAAVVSVGSEDEAVEAANDTEYGLGAAVWTGDPERGKRLAERIEAGNVFVNGMVASDPRIPFGGVKKSGYGRELSEYGIREFQNIQTVWVGPAQDAKPAQKQTQD
jgi:succinate-semialdehyde dehydrogenase/glutarate-semialdehyde dehydrogenase